MVCFANAIGIGFGSRQPGMDIYEELEPLTYKQVNKGAETRDSFPAARGCTVGGWNAA